MIRTDTLRETTHATANGLVVVVSLLLLLLASAAALAYGAAHNAAPITIGAVLVGGFILFLLTGLFIVNPNEAAVLQLFGNYLGTSRTAGLRWANPFASKQKLSLRVRNFETNKLKVN